MIIALRTTTFLTLLIASAHALAQRPGQEPHLAYAYPAGCQTGTTCEIIIGGQFLKSTNEVYLAGAGVKAEVMHWYRPLTQGMYNDLRMKLQETKVRLEAEGRKKLSDAEIAKIAGIMDHELHEMEIYRQRERDPKRQPNDQLIEQTTLRLTIDDDAEPGKRELRLLTDDAISNPLWLHISDSPEMLESEPNDAAPRAWETENTVSQLPAVVNGQIMPGDVDYFSFNARQGMRLVIQVAARDVIPYLADAVPGWFQSVLRVTDSFGDEISFADSYRYHQDPVMCFEVPRDGTYAIEVRDALYRGREDFVYRITIGETPFVTSVFPLGAQVDSEIELKLQGWNLTQDTWNVKTMTRKQYRPVRQIRIPQAGQTSVEVALRVDLWPEAIDQEPNNSAQQAQAIKTPITVNGRIDAPGDEDVFLMKGGGRLIVEVQARRLGSPLDAMLILTDEQGNELAFNDDYVDQAQSMQTHHADSVLTATIPAGTTYLHLRDAQQNGGDEFAYRLSLHTPQPDYELRVAPSSIIARAGQVVPISVFALRKDGFLEDIEVSLVDPAEGFQIDGAILPGSAESVQMTLTMPTKPPTEPIVLEMQGTAKMRSSGAKTLVRPAIPCENMMQAFIWHHLVPVENWNLVVSEKRAAKLPFQILLPSPRLTLPSGGSYIVPIAMIAKDVRGDELQIQLSDPPTGISAAIITNPLGGYAIELTIDETTHQQSLQGNLLMTLVREVTAEPTKIEPAPQPKRTDYGYLPAIPFEILKQKHHRRK